MLGYIAARTERIVLSTATTLITTNDPVKIAEDYAMLQHLADGRVDLMMGRGNTGPVYPWFGQDIRNGIELAIENYHLLHRLWREDVVDWEGKFRTPLQGFTSTPRPLDGVPPFVWHGSIRSPGDRRAGRLLRRRLLRQPHLLADLPLPAADQPLPHAGSSTTATGAPTRRSSGSAARCSCGRTARTPSREFRPYFDNAPVYGHGPSLEEFTEQTPLTVGSPQEVIEKTLTFREHFGDYQRQLFLVDHAGLPLKTVLEQLDLLGERGRAGAAPRARRPASGRRARRPRPTPACSRRAGDASSSVGTASPTGRAELDEPSRIVVLAAGLRQPSSTRLLADRLAAATRGARGAGVAGAEIEIVELREYAPGSDQPPADRLAQRAGSPQLIDAGGRRRRLIAVSPIFSGSYQRAVQDVLRRARARTRWPASRC